MKKVSLSTLGMIIILLFGFSYPADSGFWDELKKGIDDAGKELDESFGGDDAGDQVISDN